MSTRQALEQAYRLVQQDRIYDAQAVLRPILMTDPDNVHAWWLLAYASTDPDEVRRALTTVLALDPDYANAPKAREMLEQLNLLYPPDEADQVMPASMFQLEDEDFEEALGEDLETAEEPDLFAETEEEVLAPSEDVFEQEEEVFTSLPESLPEEPDFVAADDMLLVPEEPGEPYDLDAMFEEIESEEELLEIADYDESGPVIQRGGAGRWLAGLAALLIVAAAVVIVALFLLREDEDEPETDEPAALTMQLVESDAVVMAIAGAEAELASGAWGENARAFVASSALGDTLYVEFCGQPQPALSGQIMRAMAIGARQAESIRGAVDAVGVSALLCGAERRETVYRAAVPLDEAAAFAAAGDEGDISLAQFQQAWQKS